MNVMRFLMRKVDEWGWNFSRKERAAITRRVAGKKAAEEMKEVEAWGGGVSRYFTACAASGLPSPTVVEEAGFFKVVFWRQAKGAGAYDDASVITAKTTAETTAKTTAENSVQSTSSGAALSIWKLICKNPAISISALAAATSLTCDGVRYHIRRLTAQGRLKRIGGTKGGRWEVVKGA